MLQSLKGYTHTKKFCSQKAQTIKGISLSNKNNELANALPCFVSTIAKTKLDPNSLSIPMTKKKKKKLKIKNLICLTIYFLATNYDVIMKG